MKQLLIIILTFFSSCNWVADQYEDIVLNEQSHNKELSWLRDEWNSYSHKKISIPVVFKSGMKTEHGTTALAKYFSGDFQKPYIAIDTDFYYSSDYEMLIWVFFHEVGHHFGLDHNSDAKIMRLHPSESDKENIEYFINELIVLL